MRALFKSHFMLWVFMIILVIGLVACERPLNEEEEAQPTAEPTLVVSPETQPEGSAPTLVPTVEVVAPTGEAPTEPVEQPTAEQPSGGEVTDQAQPTAVPLPTATQPATQLPTGEQVHTVQAGENLFRIGLRYGCTADELAAYNGIPDPRWIYVGQQIRIPTTCSGQPQ